MSSKSVVAFIGHVDPHRFFQRHILLRVDYNVPLKKIYPGEEILVASDSRILDSLPTIKFLLAKEAKLVICSHLGRPKGPQDHELSLRPVAKHLSRLLGDVKIEFFTECIGPEVEERIIQQKPRTVIVLENLRFHSGEEANDDRFARLLAQNMDIFVNDAFSVCHRENASVCKVPHYVPQKYAGFALHREITYLSTIVEAPRKPVAAIIGGVKVSSKIDLLKTIAQHVDKLMIGGAMVFTFYKAMGYNVGDSFVEEKAIPKALEIIEICKDRNSLFLAADAIVLPSDFKSRNEDEINSSKKTVDCFTFPEHHKAMDIGPQTINRFKNELDECNTIILNGPLGYYEEPIFANGTVEILNYMCSRTSSGAITVICGGDTVAVCNSCGALNLSHISMGGGASLEFLSGKMMPGIAALPTEML